MLVKELHSTSRLLTFSEALSKIENSMPEQFQQGIASVSRLMEELIPVYKRKSDMEKACLAYVFAIFHMTKFQAKEIVFPFLLEIKVSIAGRMLCGHYTVQKIYTRLCRH